MTIRKAVIRALAQDDARVMLDCAITSPREFLVWAEALLTSDYSNQDDAALRVMLRWQLPDITIPQLVQARPFSVDNIEDDDPAWSREREG